MKKRLAALAAVALVVGSMAGSADAAKKKKPKPAPVPVAVTYSLGLDGETCVFATLVMAGDGDCGSPFWGLLGDELEPDPKVAPLFDGLPLTIDATKPIKGTIVMESYALAVGPDIVGIGQPSVVITATGTAGGTEVVIGEFTSDPYVVTPPTVEYPVEFEIPVPPELDKTVFEALSLSYKVTGPSMFHGAVQPDGTTNFTMGVYK